ncbi:hypothetical protein ACHAXA_004350 [Cyclostephanos tholiformis]|uniref:Amidase domain-containing protein n=1 Tax=Cyclostephanos tholiformis TaxID=382380 RepID=A0ABD3SQM4_9STRA
MKNLRWNGKVQIFRVSSTSSGTASSRSRSVPTATPSAIRPPTSSRRPRLGDRRHHHSAITTHLPPRLTIPRAMRLLRDSKLTSEMLCRHSYNLAVFGERSLLLNAYAKLLDVDDIMEQSKESDERIRCGHPKSDLDGIPVTMKANIAVGKYWEMPNACSAILSQGAKRIYDTSDGDGEVVNTSNDRAVYESDVARRLLKDCGAVIIGITNMDEFGMGSLGINNSLRQGTTEVGVHTPHPYTYNPIPWMHRIALLRDTKQQLFTGDEAYDDFFLECIVNSTPRNPHDIDEESLANLLNEVQYWVCGNNLERMNNGHDDSPLLSPGGSSSGAAAATSHGSCLLSIGTDTGGSLRLPAAWTSTVGFKPTYGTFSRYGVVSYASSLDTVGFVTGTTECAMISWNCLRIAKNAVTNAGGESNGWNGQLCRDPTATSYHKQNKAFDAHNQSHTSVLGQSFGMTSKPLANIRIGIPHAFSLEEIPSLIKRVWSESASSLQNVGGATLVDISDSKLSPELIKMALASYYVLACAEASSNLSRYDGLRYGMDVDLHECSNDIDFAENADFGPLLDMTTLEQQISATRVNGFGEETQRRILAGTSVLSSDRFHTHYEAAAVARAKLSRSLERIFRSSLDDGQNEGDEVDVMLVPTALTFPPKLNPTCVDGVEAGDPTAAFVNDVMTIPISLGGFPSVSVPVNTGISNINECSSIGMQIFASRGSEDLVLRVANALQNR